MLLLINAIPLDEVSQQEKRNMVKECEKTIDEVTNDWDTERVYINILRLLIL